MIVLTNRLPICLHFRRYVHSKLALKKMISLGVEVPLPLRHKKKTLGDGDKVYFEGFEIKNLEKSVSPEESESDTRVHVPFITDGSVISPATDRDLIETSHVLTDGLCGAPVMDEHGFVAGIVEGIVPTDHDNPFLAGAGATVTSSAIHNFLDQSEELMMKKILPESLINKLYHARKAIQKRGGTIPADFFESVIHSKVGETFSEEEKNKLVKIVEDVSFGKDFEINFNDLEKMANRMKDDRQAEEEKENSNREKK